MDRLKTVRETGNGLEMFYQTFKAVFRRLAVAGAVVLLALITYNLSIGDSLSQEEVFYAPDITDEELQQLPLF